MVRRDVIQRWRVAYNSDRPHSRLAYRTPAEFAKTSSELTSGMATGTSRMNGAFPNYDW